MRKRIESLNDRYGRIMKCSLLFALVFHILGFVLLPGTTPEPYRIPIVTIVDTLVWVSAPPLPPEIEPQPPVEPKPENFIPKIENSEPDEPPERPLPLEPDTPESVTETQDDETIFSGETIQVPPRPLHTVRPNYPEICRMAGIEGVVELELILDKDGSIQSIEVKESPNEALSRSAVEAAKHSRYSPAYQFGRPVKVRIQQRYHFQLRG